MGAAHPSIGAWAEPWRWMPPAREADLGFSECPSAGHVRRPCAHTNLRRTLRPSSGLAPLGCVSISGPMLRGPDDQSKPRMSALRLLRCNDCRLASRRSQPIALRMLQGRRSVSMSHGLLARLSKVGPRGEVGARRRVAMQGAARGQSRTASAEGGGSRRRAHTHSLRDVGVGQGLPQVCAVRRGRWGAMRCVRSQPARGERARDLLARAPSCGRPACVKQQRRPRPCLPRPA